MTEPIPLIKQYYEVRVEATVPAIITYRVLAASPEEAMENYENYSPVAIKYTPAKKKSLKALIYNAGTTLLRLSRSF